ncbi:hypothetical protein SAMN02799630_00773 [Paenibacillus sp. UNCCL117]|uniref:hypothetical protein n=1 Tax=unclassified Paenibacillus TaxID=185978 RepID=UPI000888357D|nr:MULTISPECIES: hypothetical protein [unclassified Paenibacillus]SDC19733.1 hypothetical protein SAMN04488602_101573 [Paenibacillus sp. cl123]SFW18471.1 hypothetical protein SAMN02799630_00773 [Paenibacillus sp. UNCCL117]
MTTTLYIMTYPFLWFGLLSFGLAFCRMRISKHKSKLVLAIILLSIMCVTAQHYELAYLFGILQPVGVTLCFWCFYKLRLFHAFLIALTIFVSGVLSEILYNSIITGFHFEQTLFYQQHDTAITSTLMTLHHLGLYVLLHRLRIGFSFITPIVRQEAKLEAISRTWVIIASGLLFFLIMFNISVYFNNHLLVPITISFIVCWSIVLILSYRKELEH